MVCSIGMISVLHNMMGRRWAVGRRKERGNYLRVLLGWEPIILTMFPEDLV